MQRFASSRSTSKNAYVGQYVEWHRMTLDATPIEVNMSWRSCPCHPTGNRATLIRHRLEGLVVSGSNARILSRELEDEA